MAQPRLSWALSIWTLGGISPFLVLDFQRCGVRQTAVCNQVLISKKFPLHRLQLDARNIGALPVPFPFDKDDSRLALLELLLSGRKDGAVTVVWVLRHRKESSAIEDAKTTSPSARQNTLLSTYVEGLSFYPPYCAVD